MAVAVVAADYTGDAAAQATRRILSGADRPTAIVYDSDVMAIAGLGVAAEMGVRVPHDVSILAWEDSPLCELVHPALTVLRRNIADYGARTARLLLECVDGQPPRSVRTPTRPSPSATAPRPPEQDERPHHACLSRTSDRIMPA